MAAQLAFPISNWICAIDRNHEIEGETLELIERHIRQFFKVYSSQLTFLLKLIVSFLFKDKLWKVATDLKTWSYLFLFQKGLLNQIAEDECTILLLHHLPNRHRNQDTVKVCLFLQQLMMVGNPVLLLPFAR